VVVGWLAEDYVASLVPHRLEGLESAIEETLLFTDKVSVHPRVRKRLMVSNPVAT